MDRVDGRCETCKWWVDDAPWKPRGACVLTVNFKGDDPAHPSSKALANGHQSDHAVLITSPDFGCVQYEKRD